MEDSLTPPPDMLHLNLRPMVCKSLSISPYGVIMKAFSGNIIIFDPQGEDEGLYQCVASNSEGVVFSPVAKVKMISVQTVSSSRVGADRGLKTDDIAVYLPVNNNGQFSEEQENIYVVMPAVEQAEK